MSYEQFINGLPRTKSVTNEYISATHTPDYYMALLTTYADTLAFEFTDIDNTRSEFPLKNFPIQPAEPPIIQHNDNTYHIWTDGSLDPNTNNMGSAAIFTDNNNNQFHTIQIRPPNNSASSTKAELIPILVGIKSTPKNKTLDFNTDSQASIDSINTRLRSTSSIRTILKLKNNDILDCIYYENKQLATPISFTKVKAHTGLPLNDLADQYANVARQTLEPVNCITYPPNVANPHDYTTIYSNGIQQGTYAATFIKFRHQDTLQTKTTEYLHTYANY
jgi:ribonuclease HI